MNNMPPPRKPRKLGPAFSVLDALKGGFSFVWRYKKTAASLAILPLIMTMFVQYLGTQYASQSPFYTGIINLPAEFITGLSCAIFVRLAFADYCNSKMAQVKKTPQIFEVETPISPDIDQFAFNLKDRFYKPGDILLWVKPVLPAIVAYSLVQYITHGVLFSFLLLYAHNTANQSENLPAILAITENSPFAQIPSDFVPLILLALTVVMIWFMRYLWLPVLIALKKPIISSYKQIGGMEASLAIGFLFLLVLVLTMILFALIISIVYPFLAFGGDDPTGFTLFISNLLNNMAMLFAQFSFMAASVHAIFSIDNKSRA